MELRQLPARPPRPFSSPPYDRWVSEGGETVSEFYRAPDGFVVRFVEHGDFAVAAQDWSVACTPVPGATRETMRDLYLNQIVPLILGYNGDLVLHASGVVAKAGVLAFIGSTGRGKSTLAASFARQGYPFVTDDGLVLDREGDRYLAKPNSPSFRLRRDSEAALFGESEEQAAGESRGKRRIAAGRSLPFQDAPVPLHSIYFLGTGEARSTEILSLTPAEALSGLMNHSFILDVEDRPRVRAHFDRLAELARRVPSFALDYPRDYEYLSQVMTAILDHARSGDIAA